MATYQPLLNAGFALLFVDDNSDGVKATPSKLASFRRAALAQDRAFKNRVAMANLSTLARDLAPEMYEVERKKVLSGQKGAVMVPQSLVDSFKAAVAAKEHCSYLMSPHQADLQLVRLLKDKRADLVYSPDGDLLIHGAPYLVRLFKPSGETEVGSLFPLSWAGQPYKEAQASVFTAKDSSEFRVTSL